MTGYTTLQMDTSAKLFISLADSISPFDTTTLQGLITIWRLWASIILNMLS
jgi:hypothetical protein